MARFRIIHCRQIAENRAEFVAQILAGELRPGDKFISTGAFEYADFQILSINQSGDRSTLTCAGSVRVEDEFANITLDTISPRLPPAGLPEPSHCPIPTPEEEEQLKVSVEEWNTRCPVQKAIAICLMRGENRIEKIAHTLGLSPDEVVKLKPWDILRNGEELIFK